MKIFLDTASVSEIRQGLEYGVIDGVTTNPSLVAKENREFIPLIKEITSLIGGPVSVEVTATAAVDMVHEAEQLAKIAENLVIKVPINLEGLKVIRQLAGRGIKTNATLIFSASQALLAAKAGAAFISPFVGRIDDIAADGMALVEEIAAIFDNYCLETEIIVASVRHPLHFVQAAKIGADIATIPFKTLTQLLNHPLTDAGIEKFLQDWQKVKK